MYVFWLRITELLAAHALALITKSEAIPTNTNTYQPRWNTYQPIEANQRCLRFFWSDCRSTSYCRGSTENPSSRDIGGRTLERCLHIRIPLLTPPTGPWWLDHTWRLTAELCVHRVSMNLFGHVTCTHTHIHTKIHGFKMFDQRHMVSKNEIDCLSLNAATVQYLQGFFRRSTHPHVSCQGPRPQKSGLHHFWRK